MNAPESSSHPFLDRLREAANADPATIRFDVVKAEVIAVAEEVFGFSLPKLLKQIYRTIGNGGVGPGPLVGLPGGYESSWGDLVQTWLVMQEDNNCQQGWLPIIDWGCARFSLIDCDDLGMVTLYEGEFHHEAYSFRDLLTRWLDGELPDFRGDFQRRDR